MAEISYIVDGSGDNGMLREGDDLREDIKETLGTYLSSLLKDPASGNEYVPPERFVSDREIDNYAYSNYFNKTSPTLGDFLTKGVDGHTLLSSVIGNDLDTHGNVEFTDPPKTVLQAKIEEILETYNRNSPVEAFNPNGSETRELGRYQGELGRHSHESTPQHKKITLEQMKGIGLSLMLKATGDDRDGTLDPNKLGLKTLLPSAVQTGATRVSPSALQAKTAFDAPRVFSSPTEPDISIENPGLFGSYGNMNSFAEPFGGIAPGGMIALALALMAPLQAATEALGLLGLIPVGGRNDPGKGPYSLGRSGPAPSGLFGKVIRPESFGFITTEHNYFDCVNKGADVFFGLESGKTLKSILGGVAEELTRIIQSPGFYAVFIRSILRSGNQLAGDLKSATSDISSGNLLSASQSVMATLETFKSSKIVAYLNMIAVFGDIQIRLEDASLDDVNIMSSVDASDSSQINNPATHVVRSRIAPGSLTLAWKNSSSKSISLLPKSFIVADHSMKTGRGSAALLADPNTIVGERISPGIVESVENTLDSEYVPFYFHDLRTNEIISFHAFLSSLSDEYSPSYDEVDAYGRIDSVMIYGGTKRNIQLSFFAVSTNPEDFDKMWQKINKLTTLVYPQFSQGRQMSTAGGTFTQPFSQIPTASPLIRLRLGDLLKTNYSKFSLARLFGLGTDSFNLTKGSQEIINAKIAADALESSVPLARYLVEKMGRAPTAGNQLDGFGISDKALLSPGRYKSIVRGHSRIETETRVLIIGIKDKSIDESVQSSFTIDRKYQVTSSEFEGILSVSFADLKIDMEYIAEKAGTSKNLTPADMKSEITNFFSSENNPIVRAFDSSRGRGLAGVITSLSFDWLDNIVWETDVWNARAPKMCKITMGFKPIHDISPGLDSSGFNRAPVYNVGNTMAQIAKDPYDDEGSTSRDLLAYNKKNLKIKQ